jgi:predicted ArsR family transcriptional regulator
MGPAEILIRGHLTAKGGARTWVLAERCGQTTAAMRAVLKRLEQRGVVARHARYSYVNDIYWVLAEDHSQAGTPDAELGPGSAT